MFYTPPTWSQIKLELPPHQEQPKNIFNIFGLVGGGLLGSHRWQRQGPVRLYILRISMAFSRSQPGGSCCMQCFFFLSAPEAKTACMQGVFFYPESKEFCVLSSYGGGVRVTLLPPPHRLGWWWWWWGGG
uniref:Uncharacterized protein n=1 Tax=Morchella brunnea TaxID=1174671 RepID=A0A8K1I7S2_9PEZI|nr:hypothetical protein LK370_mgp084 [Morchella brunnea]UBU98399.1 hypothetical protein [Morchella brunnea]